MTRDFSQRLSRVEAWQTENRDMIKQAAARNDCRSPDVISVLGVLVRGTNKHTGLVDFSIQQIADKTHIGTSQIERCLRTLTKDLQVLQTVQRAKSGGRNGGKGRAPVRRVTFLTTVDNTPESEKRPRTKAEMTPHLELNDPAPECSPLRVIPTETPYGQFSELVQSAEPATARTAGGDESKKTEGLSDWWSCVRGDALERWWADEESQGKLAAVRDRSAVKSKKRRDLQPAIDNASKRWGNHLERADIKNTDPAAYDELLICVICWTTDEGTSPLVLETYLDCYLPAQATR